MDGDKSWHNGSAFLAVLQVLVWHGAASPRGGVLAETLYRKEEKGTADGIVAAV